MMKVLIVGNSIPEGLVGCLMGSGLQTNLIRFPERQDFEKMFSLFAPDAVVFLQPTKADEVNMQRCLIDDQTARIPTLVLGSALWQRYAQAEDLHIHVGAAKTAQDILGWIRHAIPATA